MMDKLGNQHIPCTYCGEEAIQGTDPPVCKEHMEHAMSKKAECAESEPDTLKKLDANVSK